MSSTEQLEANKKLAHEYIEQVFNQHKPENAADFVTSDVVWHGGGLGDIRGVEGLTGLLKSFIGALPDLDAAEQDIVAENDLVLVRLVVTATVKEPCWVATPRLAADVTAELALITSCSVKIATARAEWTCRAGRGGGARQLPPVGCQPDYSACNGITFGLELNHRSA